MAEMRAEASSVHTHTHTNSYRGSRAPRCERIEAFGLADSLVSCECDHYGAMNS